MRTMAIQPYFQLKLLLSALAGALECHMLEKVSGTGTVC